LNKTQSIKVDETYTPEMTVIISIYREAGFIWIRLNGVSELDYPKDKLEVIVNLLSKWTISL